MAPQRFNRQDLVATPWKNGAGLTREIVCEPAGSDMSSFDWRMSIAHIGQDGPFSLFPGVDRVITLLEGAGMRLLGQAAGLDHRLDQPLQPFAFAGDVALQGHLLGGECHDFNVMTRRGRCQAKVRVCRSATSLPAASAGLLMAVTGRWHANRESLLPGQGLWWRQPGPAWKVDNQDREAALLAVSIEPSHT